MQLFHEGHGDVREPEEYEFGMLELLNSTTEATDAAELERHRLLADGFVNMQVFVARATGRGLVPWDELAPQCLHQMELAIEHTHLSELTREYRVLVASQWVVHCGAHVSKHIIKPVEDVVSEYYESGMPGLLSWEAKPGRLGTRSPFLHDASRSLYGESRGAGLDAATWRVWTERLEALGNEVGRKDVQDAASEAVKVMKQA